MTPPHEDGTAQIKVDLARMEGKLDTLAAEVSAGDKQSGQLVELLKQQLMYLQQSVDDLKGLLAAERAHTDRATSAVRVDLERQLNVATIDLDQRMEEVCADSKTVASRVHILELASERQAGAMKVLAVAGGVAITVVAPAITATLLKVL
jgi:predicted NodU family carbamoyl transferase